MSTDRRSGSTLQLLMGALALLAGTGCSHHYAVLRQSSPNPFTGKSHLAVAPPDFSHAVVNDKPVAAWVSEGGADEAKDWPENTANATKEFNEKLHDKAGAFQISALEPSAQPGPDDIVVVPTVERIQTGMYAGAWAQPTVVTVRLSLYSNGQLADEVMLNDDVQASLMRPSFNQRLADCMQDIAESVIDYVGTRTAK